MLILHSSIPRSVRVAAIAAGLEAIGRSAGTKERSVRRAQRFVSPEFFDPVPEISVFFTRAVRREPAYVCARSAWSE